MLFLILIAFAQPSTAELEQQLVEIKQEIQFQDRVKVKKTTAKIAKLLNSDHFHEPNQRHKRNFLEFVKTDLEKITSFPNRDYFQLRNDMRFLRQYSETLDRSQFSQNLSKINHLKTQFDKHSYFNFNLNKCYIGSYININRGTNNFKVIHDLLNDYESSKWKGHPELAVFYGLLCQDFYYQKDFDKVCHYLKKYESIRELDYPHDPREVVNILKLKVKALVHQKRFAEALDYYRSLDKELLTNSDRPLSIIYFHIYMNIAELFYCVDDRVTAQQYQKKSIERLDVSFSSDKEIYVELAILLRDMLASRGELASMRAVEEHFELKPLPRQAPEK